MTVASHTCFTDSSRAQGRICLQQVLPEYRNICSGQRQGKRRGVLQGKSEPLVKELLSSVWRQRMVKISFVFVQPAPPMRHWGSVLQAMPSPGSEAMWYCPRQSGNFLLLLFSNKVLLLSPRALCYLSDNKNRATQRKLIMWIYLLHLHLPKEGGKKVFQTPQLTQWVGAGLHTGLNVPYFSKDKRSRWQEEGDRMKIVSLLKDKTQNWSYTENWVVKLGGERSSLIMEGWEKHFISLSTCSCSKRMLPTKKLFNFRKRRRKIEQNLL